MFDDDTKNEASEIIRNSFGNVNQVDSTDPSDSRKDWEVLWDNAKADLVEQRENSSILEERDKKYDGVEFITYIDEQGKERELAITGIGYFNENDEYVGKMNAFGYDRLPSDVQEALGKREDVVDKWIVWNSDQEKLFDAFIFYQRDDSHGYDTWEEYRDAKGLSPKEEIVLSKAQDVDEVTTPKETPLVEQDDITRKL